MRATARILKKPIRCGAVNVTEPTRYSTEEHRCRHRVVREGDRCWRHTEEQT